MTRWMHDVSRHSLAQVQERLARHGYQSREGEVIFCDTAGHCYFDSAPNPYQDTIREILDEKGRDGWELVQIAFREQEFICFWRRPGE